MCYILEMVWAIPEISGTPQGQIQDLPKDGASVKI